MRWSALYGCAALLCASAAWRPLPRALPMALAALAGVWAALLAPGVLSAARFTGSEEERELAGLLLVVGAGCALGRLRARAPEGGE